jgi:hypothetical protein
MIYMGRGGEEGWTGVGMGRGEEEGCRYGERGRGGVRRGEGERRSEKGRGGVQVWREGERRGAGVGRGGEEECRYGERRSAGMGRGGVQVWGEGERRGAGVGRGGCGERRGHEKGTYIWQQSWFETGKVSQHDPVPASEQDILTLDVPMVDLLNVTFLEDLKQLENDPSLLHGA